MYNFTFTQKEKNLFNAYKREKSKIKDMSIYEHLLYMLNNAVTKEIITGTALKGKGYKEILKFLNFKQTNKITENELRSSLSRLESYNLIKIKKNETNEYEFARYFDCGENMDNSIEHPIEHPNSHPLQSSECIDISEIEDSESCTNLQTTEKKIKDIDNKSTTEVCATNSNLLSRDNIKFIGDHLPKVESWSEISSDLEEAFRVAKVRSKKIKSEVIDKLERNLTNITKKFAFNYILKTVIQVKGHYEALREKYKAIMFNNTSKKKSSFNNFEQRNYDFKELEKQLLGWSN